MSGKIESDTEKTIIQYWLSVHRVKNISVFHRRYLQLSTNTLFSDI